jgi:hypothetical protein
MTQCTGSPPPSCSQPCDRTRTWVSWVPRCIVTPSVVNTKYIYLWWHLHLRQKTLSDEIYITGGLTVHWGIQVVMTPTVYRYWHSSSWNPRHITCVRRRSGGELLRNTICQPNPSNPFQPRYPMRMVGVVTETVTVFIKQGTTPSSCSLSSAREGPECSTSMQ